MSHLTVSIPFIAGQWSLQKVIAPRRMAEGQVSIPFIAGQWSLPGAPLSARSAAMRRFNPLHCGAVVASSLARRPGAVARHVSIPFIAGQWSLHGAGRRLRARRMVSIPFIAGQWSLRAIVVIVLAPTVSFQSPSLRGSGRFEAAEREAATALSVSQSPSLRGIGRFSRGLGASRVCLLVSIPFIAGQWSLPRQRVAPGAACSGLNPLHCGAVVASGARHSICLVLGRVSIPFIAGQWSLRAGHGRQQTVTGRLNPLHCGAVVASAARRGGKEEKMERLNPLHCGAVVASQKL